VPTGDGDSFEVVLGSVLTLMRSEEASPEQEGPLVVEPVGDELVLIEEGSSHISTSSDGQALLITDCVVMFEFTYSWMEDLTEQAAADYDYELEEGWLEEQLLDNPDAEV
jgi:hypothetical protein